MKNLSLCIFGNPLKHSISPDIHQAFAKQFDLALSYIKIEPALSEFEQAVDQFQASGGYGANVTSPFKERAFTLCDSVSERARIAKSVNTLSFKAGKISGDNTDGIGLLTDIQKNLRYSLTNKKIIVLGAGGAARGILQPLKDQQPADIFIFNRTFDRARKIADEFCVNYLDSLENISADVVIDCLPFDADVTLPSSFLFSDNSLFYDLKYHGTLLKNNATIQSNGKGMVIAQAAESFYVWTGKRPSTPIFF